MQNFLNKMIVVIVLSVKKHADIMQDWSSMEEKKLGWVISVMTIGRAGNARRPSLSSAYRWRSVGRSISGVVAVNMLSRS